MSIPTAFTHFPCFFFPPNASKPKSPNLPYGVVTILTILCCCGCCMGALPGEGGVVSSSCVGALSSEGGAIRSSYAQEEWGSTVASEGALLLQGKWGALLRGALLGGAWNITTSCCGGMGKHCCIQECYYEQSKSMQGTTLVRGAKWSCRRTVL
jgi:hypothetical protein